MCIFCAAVPLSASVGVAIAGKQRQQQLRAYENGKELPLAKFPTRRATVVITGSLLVCSAVYHLVIMPHTGAII